MAATELNQKCLKAQEIAFQEPIIIGMLIGKLNVLDQPKDIERVSSKLRFGVSFAF